MLLTNTFDKAKEIIRKVTTHALKEMPGLTINGAIYKVEDESDAKQFHQAVKVVHERLEKIRYQIPSNLQRFQRLPFVAECASSNLPAQDIKIFYEKQGTNLEEVDRKVFSQPILTKRNALVKTKGSKTQDEEFNRSRIVKTLEDAFQAKLFKDLEELEKNFEKKADWLAVVHADGNGLGEIFLKFDKYADMSSGESYRKNYKEFSDEIDICTRNAFGKALQNLQTKFVGEQIPVVPLILGGDDLTFICDGEYAISLTKEFLKNFEIENSENEVIKKLTQGKSLGICAGIAIIKPHYPFHQAYSLAEELLQSAKNTKKISPSLSAFDYHVLYDSSGTTLEEIREKTPFVARPYIVSDEAEEIVNKEEKLTKEEKELAKVWVNNHHFEKLKERVEAMTAKDDDDKNKLPNSQLHVLREGLYVAGKTVEIQKEVDARAKLIAHRYETFKKLYAEDKSLFFDEDGEKLTHFLGALDVVEFWK